MGSILFAAHPNTNYVFHMLSVARVGYDNAYGARYRDRYSEEELLMLKQSESLLTVCGGAHIGALYPLLVMRPARGRGSVRAYYRRIEADAGNGRLAKRYLPYRSDAAKIADVFQKHFDAYQDGIWPEEKARIEAYIPPVEERFEKTRFSQRAEQLVGVRLEAPYFTAAMVSSVYGGAEGIDLSENLDVFGIERDVEDAYYFIGHEFIVFLLFRALKRENAFRSHATWDATEGLAAYYLKKITGDVRFFTAQQAYVRLYEQLEGEGVLSAAALYREALRRGLQQK